MAKQAKPRGKCIAKVGHFRIYQKNKQEMIKGPEKNSVTVERTVSTEISIYNGKHLITGDGNTGFKNKALAETRAKELLQQHMEKIPK